MFNPGPEHSFRLIVMLRIWIDNLFQIKEYQFIHSVCLCSVVSCLKSLILVLWCFLEFLLFIQAYFAQYLGFFCHFFLLSAAMQQVLDNLTDLPTSTGAEEIDLIFLKGIMENPIVRSLAKVFQLPALSRIWESCNWYCYVNTEYGLRCQLWLWYMVCLVRRLKGVLENRAYLV